jgi:excisionase family DNA binding protein
MALLTTHEAAERLGLSVRHVQRLVSGGDLVAVGPDRIDADSVAQWTALGTGPRVRAWEEPTAWAAVALLEDGEAPWLGQPQRSRLRAALAGTTASELAVRTRNRAQVQRYHAHPRALGHLTRDVVSSGASRGVGGLSAAADRLDGYVAENERARLERRYRLDADPAGSVTLRATGMPIDVVTHLAAQKGHVLAGLDLAGSTDPRERSTGQRLLERALERLRG